MKNTKKLLMIFCSVVVLLATVFAIVSTAVVAGENTTVNEYANMKITASHGFEDGTYKSLFSNIVNGGIPLSGGIYTTDNGIRRAAASIYGNGQSLRYFMIDYDTNSSGADLYIQPKLGVLDNVEKTPVNGFVAEFDIIFLTPVTPVMEQKVDDFGNLMWEISAEDENGNPIYTQATDEKGNLLWETDENGDVIYVQKTDENGNPVFDDDGNPVYKQEVDAQGNPVWVKDKDGNVIVDENNNPCVPQYQRIPQRIPVMQNVQEPLYSDEYEIEGYEPVFEKDANGDYVLDGNGEKIPVYEKDANGDYVLDGNGDRVQKTEPIYAYEIDHMEPVYETDENGDFVLDDAGNKKPLYWYDENDNRWPVETPVYKLDENGEKIKKRLPVTDENGEMVMVNKVIPGEFTGLSTTLGIGMYNTHTYKEGKVDLLTFKANSLDKNGNVPLDKIKGNLLKNAPTFAAVPDEWCHITIQYDAKSNYTYIYVGRDDSEFDSDGDGTIDTYGRMLLGYLRSTYTLESGEEINVYPLQFRLGCKSTKGAVGFDNFIGYQGTTIHDPTVLNEKLPFEKYLYLADVLANGHEYKTVKDVNGNVVYQVLVDENGEVVYEIDEATGEFKLDGEGNKIPVYMVDSFGNKVPVYALDENGKKVIEKAHNTSADRYQAFVILTTDDVYKKVYTQEELGGEPTLEQMEALEAAYRLVDIYSADKKNEENNDLGIVGVYDELVKEAKIENAATYLSYAINALEAERTLSNYADRLALIVKAEEFYNSVGSLIARDSEGDFGEAVKIIKTLEVLIKGDEAAYNFVNWMKMFNSSVSYGAAASRLKSHYNNAEIYYNQIMALGEDYTVDTLEEANAESYTTALADFLAAGDIVSDNIKAANSARFVGIVSIMQRKSKGTWSLDGEDVEALWLRAFEIILDNNYDASGEDFAVAKVIFESANEYFYAKMQNEHIAVISAKLDSYNDSNMTYIDKAGICTYVERYIQLNEKYLDLDSIEIKREIARNDAYKLQLNTLVEDYKKLLVENAPKFMSVVKMAAHYSTYDMLKPLYDQATEYYYKMNIEGDGIEECIAQYEELRSLITSIERDSTAYIDIIYGNVVDENGEAIYKPMTEIDNKKDLYRSLTEAYLCFENLDITYPGAAEAKAVYDAKYKEYTENAITVNAELANAETTVYAVRGNWSFDTVVVFVKKLINKGVAK